MRPRLSTGAVRPPREGHLKRRGGALITVGSVVFGRAFPVQGIYSASKAATTTAGG